MALREKNGCKQTILAGEAMTEKNSASAKQKKPGAYLQAREPSKSAEFFLRVSMGLTVRRKTAKNLAVRRKNERILAVSRKKN